MLYVALVMWPEGEKVVSDASWQSPADVCRAFGIEGHGQIKAARPDCQPYLFWRGPWAGKAVRIMPLLTLADVLSATQPSTTHDEAWAHGGATAARSSAEAVAKLGPYPNGEVGHEELAADRRSGPPYYSGCFGPDPQPQARVPGSDDRWVHGGE